MEDIERRLVALIETFTDSNLPRAVVNEAIACARAREWGVAFELLCDSSNEYDVSIADSQFSTMEELGNAMQIDPATWVQLRHLVG